MPNKSDTARGARRTESSRALQGVRGGQRLLRRAIRQAELMGYRFDGVETDCTRSDLEVALLALWRRHSRNPKRRRIKQSFGTAPPVSETGPAGLAAGVARFTDRHLEEESRRIVADVARALSKEVPVG